MITKYQTVVLQAVADRGVATLRQLVDDLGSDPRRLGSALEALMSNLMLRALTARGLAWETTERGAQALAASAPPAVANVRRFEVAYGANLGVQVDGFRYQPMSAALGGWLRGDGERVLDSTELAALLESSTLAREVA